MIKCRIDLLRACNHHSASDSMGEVITFSTNFELVPVNVATTQCTCVHVVISFGSFRQQNGKFTGLTEADMILVPMRCCSKTNRKKSLRP